MKAFRAASALAGLWLALILGRPAWAASAAEASAAPAPLYVDCRGERSAAPTVILEAGAFGTSSDWDRVLDDLAAGGRACAYDRSGLGASPGPPAGVDVLARAREIGALLDQLGESGPVILVGHSNGALYIQAFADLQPNRVAGLVYVNGVVGDALDDPRLLTDLRRERRNSAAAVTAGQLGLGGLVASTLDGGMRLGADAQARKHAALTCLACLKVARDEDRAIIPGLTAVRALDDAARHIPTVVIEGDQHPGTPLALAWKAAETAPARRADHAWILDMPGATHVSPLSRDRAYVKAAVDWLRAPFAAAASDPGGPVGRGAP